jgi:hypothetical protein
MVHGFAVRMVPTQTDPTLGYFVLDVPHSSMAPHAVRREEHGVYFYPLRHGTTTAYLGEPEIAARYRNRFELARGQVDRLGQLHQNAPRMNSTGAVVLAVGVVPAISGFRPLTGTGRRIQTYVENVWNPAGTRIDPKNGQYRTARRRLRITGSTYAVELHEDGAAWAQMTVGRAPGDGVCVIDLPDLEKTAVVLTSLIGGYAAWAGAAGDCVVGAWLSDGPPKIGIQLGASVEWVGLPARGISAETTAPIDELNGGPVRVGRVVYPLIRDIEQEMGIPEPEALRPDGSVLAG